MASLFNYVASRWTCPVINSVRVIDSNDFAMEIQWGIYYWVFFVENDILYFKVKPSQMPCESLGHFTGTANWPEYEKLLRIYVVKQSSRTAMEVVSLPNSQAYAKITFHNGDALFLGNVDGELCSTKPPKGYEPDPPTVLPVQSTPECVICFEPPETQYLVIPCGHAPLCEECIQRIQMCPVCRSPITHIQKLFLVSK